MAFDGEEFGKQIVDAVNASIDRVVAPLVKRLDELEVQQHRSQDMLAVIGQEITETTSALIKRFDSYVTAEQIKDLRGELESTIGPELQIALSKMVEAIPPAPAGKDAEPVDMSVVKQMIADEVAAIPPAPAGKDAESVDMDVLKSWIEDEVASISIPAPELPDIAVMIDEAVKALPPAPAGKDAEPVDMTVVKQMIAEMIPAPIAGKDGADVLDMIIGKDDHLHVTLSNGNTKDLGRVVGWDGVDVDIDGVNKRVNEMIAALPPAADGKDGMGFDDLSVEYDGERTFKFVLARGDERKEYAFPVPMVIYRETFKEDVDYAKGDAVTWDGSMWVAQIDGAKQKPGHLGNKEWRLAVKKGNRGKDGVMTVPRPNEPVKLGGR